MDWDDAARTESREIIANASSMGILDLPKIGAPGPFERISGLGELELAYAIDVLALNGTADDWVRTVNGHAEQVGRFILHTDEQGFKRLQSFLSDDAASVAISDLAEELDEAS